jgi:hypothetical protein
MSTAITLPGSQLSTAATQHQPVVDPGYRPLTLGERLHRTLLGCHDHNYTWPVSLSSSGRQLIYPKGFDSHQACAKCGAERFYNSRTMQAGKQFLRTDHSTPCA